MKSRDIDRLVDTARKQGFRTKSTRKGVVVYGKQGGIVTVHLTCSDYRAFKNTRADLIRLGVRFE